MLGRPGKMARKRCSRATDSIFEPGSVIATKCRPAFSRPTASTAFAQKNWGDAMTLWQYGGFWARQNKNLDDALAASKRSVELLPGLNYLWNTLSLVYEKMQNYPEAIKAAEKALETAPEAAKATYQKTIDRLKAAQTKK